MYKHTEPKIIVCKYLPDALSAIDKLLSGKLNLEEPTTKEPEEKGCDCAKNLKFAGLKTQVTADDFIQIVKTRILGVGVDSVEGRAVITDDAGEPIDVYADIKVTSLLGYPTSPYRRIRIRTTLIDEVEVYNIIKDINIPYSYAKEAWDCEAVRDDFERAVKDINDMIADYLMEIGFISDIVEDTTDTDPDFSEEAEKAGLIEDAVRTHIQHALIAFLSDRTIRKEPSSIQLNEGYKVEFNLMYTSIKDRSVNVDYVIQADLDGQMISCDRGRVKIDFADLKNLKGVEAAIEDVLEAVIVSWHNTMTTWNRQPVLID